MSKIICFCALLFWGCSILGSYRTYVLKSSDGKSYSASQNYVFMKSEDFRGTWGFIPILPIIPYVTLEDIIEIRFLEMNEDDCPVILHGNDSLSFHYHRFKGSSSCPYSYGCVYEPCDAYRECHYIAKKSWSNEPLKVLYPNGKVDTLYIERLSNFKYSPFGVLVEDFSHRE